MRKSSSILRRTRWIALASAVIALVCVTSFVFRNGVSANHPVLVEGNCDSPVPGTTLVAPGTCGDFDGDGRIGTAEDTDGADRIFGTINAALGPGTGAAAGTGANHNGLVKIVASGRYAESVFIGSNLCGPGCPGSANPGNVTLEAAPGVAAIIDAVLQGDPAGGNATRQNGTGVGIEFLPAFTGRVVTLRNLVIRNFDSGVIVGQNSNVVIDNCRLENNLNFGLNLNGPSRTVVRDTQVTATGFRIGGPTTVPTSAFGIVANPGAIVRVVNSTVSNTANIGIFNPGPASAVTLYKVGVFYSGNVNLAGGFSMCTDAAVCQ
jgi:Right handed beta helix region